MGCDIHAHFEIKVNGKWISYTQPRIQRWYDLFSKIAGVRNYGNEIKPITLPRGLPLDVSQMTKLHSDYDGIDGHSHTWLNADEIKELVSWVESNTRDNNWIGEWEHRELGYLFGNGWGEWKQYPDSYPNFIEDIRFVCWFDN